MAQVSGKVIHVHLLARCNLRCAHCYSDSAPERAEQLDAADLVAFCTRIRPFGYETVSLSGGEPTLYAGLAELILGLQDAGLAVNMISNGLRTRTLSELRDQGWTGALGISFDGLAPTHDAIRVRSGSFAAALATLTEMIARGGRIGANICVSNKSYGELPDLVGQLAVTGLGFMHFHPLTNIGRAEAHQDLWLRPADHAPLWLMVRLFAEAYPEVRLRADVTRMGHFGDALGAFGTPRAPGTIIVDEVGDLYPLCYGIGAEYRLGNIRSAGPADLLIPDQLDAVLQAAFSGDPDAFVDPYATILQAVRAARPVEPLGAALPA